MRFMMLMLPGGDQHGSTAAAPEAAAVERMMQYNRSLQKAGVLLALDGLHPPALGVRVSFRGGHTSVSDGPFAETKEVVGGYWLIAVKSKEEAIEWARRCPAADGDTVEVRQVHELTDLPPDVQKVARL